MSSKQNTKIMSIVLTGGPCAGKSTALATLSDALSEKGYGVVVINETATELIKNGMNPESLEFQNALYSIQKAKEEFTESYCKSMSNKTCKPYIIICDRGQLDAKAYMGNDDYTKMITDSGMNEISIRDKYDAVFHLVSVAVDKKEVYTKANNGARQEDVNSAVLADEKTKQAWVGHPHFRVISNAGSFDEKMTELKRQIYSFLGEPVPNEIERKYLIEKPDLNVLVNKYGAVKSEIRQTYLLSENNTERRIRRRGIDGNYSYFFTEKIGNGISRIEKEKMISEEEYNALLLMADNNKKPIDKNRYCFVDHNQYFELDVYPDWDDNAIVEIELTGEEDIVRMPDYIHVVKEVTNDETYRNGYMASHGLSIHLEQDDSLPPKASSDVCDFYSDRNKIHQGYPLMSDSIEENKTGECSYE